MSDWLKVSLLCIAVLGSILVVDYFSILWEGVTAPKREEIRRDVWENTRSFREGKRQELIRYMYQFNTAEDMQTKRAIASTVRLNFADVDTSDFQPELKSFLNKCMTGRL